MTVPSREVELLAELLEATHAAVYGYAALGARLDEPLRRAALHALDEHRSRRDVLAALLRARGLTPPVAAAAYVVDVRTPAAALVLAVRLEEGLSVRWRDLVAGTDDEALRRLGLAGLRETAVRAAGWRDAAGSGTVTVAFPGSL